MLPEGAIITLRRVYNSLYIELDCMNIRYLTFGGVLSCITFTLYIYRLTFIPGLKKKKNVPQSYTHLAQRYTITKLSKHIQHH